MSSAIKGGEFLIKDTKPQDIFIPEDWNEEQQMIGEMCREFIKKEVHPILDRIDAQEEGLMESLMDKAGELKHINKLESFFGLKEEEIKKLFYKQEIKHTLFGELESISKISKPIERIAGIYSERMKEIWKYVTEEPLRLDNRNGVPLFHFVFASNNEKALKIANQIIKKI